MESPPTAMTIDYARGAHPKRRLFWWLMTVVALAALVAASVRWHGAISRRAQTLYWQHKCMNYSPPTDLVTIDFDASRFASLLNKSGDYKRFSRTPDWRNGPQFTDDHVWFAPECWRKFELGRWEPGPAFLHRR